MYFICQLKDGYMLSCVERGIYRVVNTGYPYPDTPYPADVMIRNMLKALGISTVVKDLDIPALQVLLRPYAGGVDISADTLRQIITGKAEKKVSTTASIFFRSKSIVVYFVKNAKYNSCVSNYIGDTLKLGDEDIFIFSHDTDKTFRDMDLVTRESLQEFSMFNSGIKEYNTIHEGIEFYESWYVGVENRKPVAPFEAFVVRMGNRSYREMGEIIVGYLLNCLPLHANSSETIDMLRTVSKLFYGIDILSFADVDLLKRYTIVNNFEMQMYLFAILHCHCNTVTSKKLETIARRFVTKVYWMAGFNTSRFMCSYSIKKTGVSLIGLQSLSCLRDMNGGTVSYRNMVDLILRTMFSARVSEKVAKDKSDMYTEIAIGGMLGSNFTSYEERLLQYITAYKMLFDKDIPLRGVGCEIKKNWVDKFLSYFYENYQRRFIMGGFDFDNSTEFAMHKLNIRFTSREAVVNGLCVPNLFKELKLDNFNGRQLTEEEIIFISAFMFYIDSTVLAAEKGEGIYKVRLYKTFFTDKKKVKDSVVKIPSSVHPLIYTFMKMYLLYSAASLTVTPDGQFTPDGDYDLSKGNISLGKSLFVDGVVNSLSDDNFKMTIGDSYASMIMYMKG